MTMKLNNILVGLVAMLTFYECPHGEDPVDATITVVNMGSDTISFGVELPFIGSDTLPINTYNSAQAYPELFRLEPGQVKSTEGVFFKVLDDRPQQRGLVYIMLTSAIADMPFQVDSSELAVLRRVPFTLEDIRDGEFVVEYP